jgi:MFS family permease
VVESKVKAPIIQFSLLTRRVFLVGLIANFSLAVFYAIDFFLIPLYLHYMRGQSGNEIGFTLLPATLLVAFLSPLAGRIVDKKGTKPVLVFGLSMLCISALLQTQFDAGTQLYLVVGAYISFGIGWAFILSPSLTTAIASVPKESGGVAAGTIGTFHNLGGAMGLAFGTLIFSSAAYSSLYTAIAGMGIKTGDWLATATTNTEQATEIIASNTHLSHATAAGLFDQFFLHGYSSAMWLLVALPLLSLCFVLFGYKKKDRPAHSVSVSGLH